MKSRFAAVVMLAVLALLPATGARGATGDSADLAAALTVVNRIRSAANLPAVTVNADAGTDATATARYSVLNNACLHNVEENPTNPYATPQSTHDWGAQDQFCSPAGPMSYQQFAGLFSTLPYHADHFIDPNVTQVGFGYYQAQPSDSITSGGLTGATDLNFVYSGASPTYPVLFPANGQTFPASVLNNYSGGEDPDPLANCSGYAAPTGAPLMAQFATTPNVSQVTLSQGSSTVPSCWFTSSTDVNHDLEINTLIVLPKAPLANGTYSACVQFSDGSASLVWTFGVGGAPASTTATCAGQASGPPANFAGTWSTDWYGNLTITQTGNQVSGCMNELPSGGLTGSVTGNQLNGIWQNDLSNPLPGGIGLTVTISADGTTFAGNIDNNSYLTAIHGTRTTSSNPCTPPGTNSTTAPSNPSGSPSTSTPAPVTPTPSSTPSVGTPVYNTPTPSNAPPPGCSTPAPGSQVGVCTQATPVAEPGTANTIIIQSGNNQQLALNSAGGLGEAFAPLSVGGLAPGVSVTFTCSAPSGVLCDLANGGATTVSANANGVATLASNGIGIYSQGGTGTLTVRATAPGYASATFSETVLAQSGSPNPTPQAALTPSVGSAVYASPNVAYQQLPGVSASDIGVGADGSVWVTGTNQGIYQLTGTNWSRTDGAAVRIAVGPDGTPWVVNSAGSVYHRVDNAWQLLSAAVTGATSPLVASDIGVGADGSVWVTGTNQGIYQLSGTIWTRTDGAAVEIAVGPDGTPWVVNSSGSVYHRVNNVWQLLSAAVTGGAGPLVASDIGVGADGGVWVTGTNQDIYQLSGTNWTPASGAATEVAVQNSGVFYVANAAGFVYMGTVTP